MMVGPSWQVLYNLRWSWDVLSYYLVSTGKLSSSCRCCSGILDEMARWFLIPMVDIGWHNNRTSPVGSIRVPFGSRRSRRSRVLAAVPTDSSLDRWILQCNSDSCHEIETSLHGSHRNQKMSHPPAQSICWGLCPSLLDSWSTDFHHHISCMQSIQSNWRSCPSCTVHMQRNHWWH